MDFQIDVAAYIELSFIIFLSREMNTQRFGIGYVLVMTCFH